MASGSKSLDVTYFGVWDRWENGGKGLCQVSWNGLAGMIQLQIILNDIIDDVETDQADVQKSIAGNVVTLTFDGSLCDSFMIGFHINHASSIDNLNIIDFSYILN